MPTPDLSLRIHEAALLIEKLPSAPCEEVSEDLKLLFLTLHDGEEEQRSTIEGNIWEIWCAHEDPEIEAEMEQAITAMNAGEHERAEGILDGLVGAWPGWAEAWNKRATLYFVLGRDAESVGDIQRTLELEPRHFGALCGFAQIAGRNGDAHAARIALERALVVHPGLPGVPSAIEQLGANRTETLH